MLQAVKLVLRTRRQFGYRRTVLAWARATRSCALEMRLLIWPAALLSGISLSMKVRQRRHLPVIEEPIQSFQGGRNLASIPTPPLDTEEDLKASKASSNTKVRKRPRTPPGPRLNPAERALMNPRSLRWAIKAKCFVCCGGGQDDGVRVRIRECTVVICPLHVHRPYQTKDD